MQGRRIIKKVRCRRMARPRKTPQVINTERPEAVKTSTKSNEVLVCFNGVQAQRFEVPMKSGGKKVVIINGNNTDLIGSKKGELYAGGYGLTRVDREAWEWILEHYKNWGPIKSGLMFASSDKEAAADVKAREGLRNGYEPLKRNKISGVEEKSKE